VQTIDAIARRIEDAVGDFVKHACAGGR
jgi:hypothetical protein